MPSPPGPQQPDTRRYVVAKVQDVPEGNRLVIDVGGRSIGIFNIAGIYYGLLNRCPHQGGPMCAGDILGSLDSAAPGQYQFGMDRPFLACPWHGWEFDIKT